MPETALAPETAVMPVPVAPATLIVQKVVTVLLIAAPVVAIGAAVWLALPPTVLDIGLLLVMTTIAMLGVTVGFHRMLTHRAFTAAPWLRDLLVWAGATSLEGSPVGWAAMHREHHHYSDTGRDPHSPHAYGSVALGTVRGFVHAHMGWLIEGFPSKPEKYAPDLLADRRLMRIDAWWWAAPLLTVLVVPVAVGWAFGGVRGAVTTLVWAGLLRIGLVHHFTWSVNSVCHLWGEQPFETRDQSRNVSWLALVSAGESWHNAHHAFPTLARHGVDDGQMDLAGDLIAFLERRGWVTNVKWPDAQKLDARRRKPDPAVEPVAAVPAAAAVEPASSPTGRIAVDL
jgi:stearoyl-CoA desaturase (delta-9 desaturase)